MTYEFDNLPNLPELLIRRTKQIPAGRVTTYGSLADSLGDRIAARWVASFLLHAPQAADCPSHRVVRADRTLGKYFHGDLPAKRQRLQAEGISVIGEQLELADYYFAKFRGSRPLLQLREQQLQMRENLQLRNLAPRPRWIGGTDLSYLSDNMAVAAYVLTDIRTGEVVWSTTVTGQVPFPYISSYLAFREVPLTLEVIKKARRSGHLADVIMVDGSGVLHPHRIGQASQLGIACGIPTIGVTKTHLTGRLDSESIAVGQPVAVRAGVKKLGWAMRTRESSKKRIYVSPGHGVTVDSAKRVTLRLCLGRSLPEPVYWADKISREEVKRLRGL